jgi:CheY-like chemotaxis protein
MKSSFVNIFLADDDCDDVDFFQFVVGNICPGCNLRVFGNGQELVDALRNTADAPDIIFLDVNMPIMKGLDALEIIKELPAMASVPVIVYSTSFNEHDIQQAMEYGASSYIVKPSDLEGLKRLIEKTLHTDWAASAPVKQEEFVLRG